jgi:GT2 family glycosyltransferase
MKDRPRILVVTPTLGTSEFLDRSVASVASQPLDVLHVISAPEPARARLEERYPWVRVVPDAGRAGGIYGALNAALAAVPEGWDWFTYINDDDALLPGFAAAFTRHLRRPVPEPVVYGDVDLIDEQDRLLSRVTVEGNPAWLPALLQQGISPLTQQGMFFHRELVRRLGGFDLHYRLCADLAFWLRAYAAGWKFRYYPIRVARFRIRPGQLSGSTAVTRREQAEIVAQHLRKEVPAWKRRLARWKYRVWNLPRYWARLRSRGLKTSYQLLEGGRTAR